MRTRASVEIIGGEGEWRVLYCCKWVYRYLGVQKTFLLRNTLLLSLSLLAKKNRHRGGINTIFLPARSVNYATLCA